MKEIVSQGFRVLAKSKYPKSETEPYNPWAVCNKSTGGKKKNKDKFERCVHHLKDQNREKNEGKKKKSKEAAKIDVEKPSTKIKRREYIPVDPDTLFQDKLDREFSGEADRDRKFELDDAWLDAVRKHRHLVPAKGKSVVIEAKKKDGKWMQKAVKHPGAFTDYCGGEVTDECVERGKNSPDSKTRQRANLADTFRSMGKKKKKKD